MIGITNIEISIKLTAVIEDLKRIPNEMHLKL